MPTYNLNQDNDDGKPDYQVGNRWIWNRTDEIPNYLLPLNGQTISNCKVQYPRLWAVRTFSTLIDSFDNENEKITLKNYNNESRFVRANITPGIEQDDTTAVNGLRLHVGNNKTRYVSGEPQSVKDAFKNWVNDREKKADVVDGDDETRPINFSEIWCIIAKPLRF